MTQDRDRYKKLVEDKSKEIDVLRKDNIALKLDLVAIRMHRDEYKKLVEAHLNAPSCNDCGATYVCKVKPEFGEQCRFNCHLWVPIGK